MDVGRCAAKVLPFVIMRYLSPLVTVVTCVVLAGCPAPPKQVGDVSAEGSGPKSDEPSTKWEGATAPKPAQPTSGSSATVNEAPTRRSDQYDKEGTDIVLRRSAIQVKGNCGAAKGDDGKATGPWGKMSIQVALGSNGHSKGVTVPQPFQGKPVGNCIEKAFANLSYPPWGGSDASVDWEVELIEPPQEPAPARKK
jgi:hypothetical protein